MRDFRKALGGVALALGLVIGVPVLLAGPRMVDGRGTRGGDVLAECTNPGTAPKKCEQGDEGGCPNTAQYKVCREQKKGIENKIICKPDAEPRCKAPKCKPTDSAEPKKGKCVKNTPDTDPGPTDPGGTGGGGTGGGGLGP